jgi:diguanylate cyclase (GGDEF)-like protein
LADWLDNVQVLGLLVQASGAALIAAFSYASWRHAGHAALRLWCLAWALLCFGLLALLLGLAVPALAWPADSAYLFGEYGFLYFLVIGLRRLDRFAGPTPRPTALAAAALVVAIVLPWLAGFAFERLFAVQSVLLAIGFGMALASIPVPAPGVSLGAGLGTVRASLVALFAIFVHYVPIFGLVVSGRLTLPLDYLKLTSIAHLVAEFALGYAGAMAVLELSHSHLLSHNHDLRRNGERLRKLSETDPLTGTLNRRALTTILAERAVAGRDGDGSVALLDVDDMKRINAHGGHPLGDAALRALAISTAVLARDEDLVVRWGGDEFLLVAFGVAPDALQRVLDPLPAQLVSRRTLADAPADWLGASFGVAGFDSYEGIEAAVRDADAAMFAQKQRRKSPDGGHGPPADAGLASGGTGGGAE